MKRKPLNVGDRVGMLVLLEETKKDTPSRPNETAYLCRCDCGNTKIISRNVLVRDAVKSCGCLLIKENIVGKRFGMLVVVGKTDKRNDWNEILWECKCDCGGVAFKSKTYLKHHPHPSCGCQEHLTQKEGYKSWATMIQRCCNKNTFEYKYYGGRGIKVCDRWREGFFNFYMDMGDRPPGCTLERIDVNGDYTPENCRWATLLEQGDNRRNTVRVEYNGTIYTLGELSKMSGIKRRHIYGRIRNGWSVERAITEPVKTK